MLLIAAWRKIIQRYTRLRQLTSNSGYTTAHAVKVFDKFFPSPQTANVRFMVSPSYLQAYLENRVCSKHQLTNTP